MIACKYASMKSFMRLTRGCSAAVLMCMSLGVLSAGQVGFPWPSLLVAHKLKQCPGTSMMLCAMSLLHADSHGSAVLSEPAGL